MGDFCPLLKSKLGKNLSNGCKPGILENNQKVIALLECFDDFVDFHLLMTKYK